MHVTPTTRSPATPRREIRSGSVLRLPALGLTWVVAAMACLMATTGCFGPGSSAPPSDAAAFDALVFEAEPSADAAADATTDAAVLDATRADAARDAAADATVDSGVPIDSGVIEARVDDATEDAPADVAADAAPDVAPEASVEAALPTEALAVTVTGSGGVTDGSGLIACGSAGASCAASYVQGTPVTLTATPDPGQTFAGWGGDCSGTGTCALSMAVPRTVTAQFVITQYPLDVTLAGTGSGTVVGGPIDCGGGATTCSANRDTGTMVTLTATATGNTNVFTGWSGACTGTQATCTVTMTQARSVTATFAANTLTVQVTGHGTLSGGGLSVGRGQTQVSAPQPLGTQITVTVQFVPNWFLGWGADCSSLNGSTASLCSQSLSPSAFSCTLTLDGPKTAVAQFYDDNSGCPSVMDPTTSCSVAANFNCCYRSDGTSPYDCDGDGFMACDTACGAGVDRCSTQTSTPQPCDCDDTNAAIYPGATAPGTTGCPTCSSTLRLVCDCSGACP